MRTIKKYAIPLEVPPGGKPMAVTLPRGSKVLAVERRGGPHFWAEVDPSALDREYTIFLFVDGEPLHKDVLDGFVVHLGSSVDQDHAIHLYGSPEIRYAP